MIYGLVHFSLESGVMQPVRYVHHLRLKFAKRSFHGGLQEFREHYADTVNRLDVFTVHSHVSHVASSFAVSLWQPLTPRSLHGPRQGQGLQLSHNRVTAAATHLEPNLAQPHVIFELLAKAQLQSAQWHNLLS